MRDGGYPDAPGTLAELFQLGAAVDGGTAADALKPVDPADLVAAGLLAPAPGDRLRAPVRIGALDGMLAVHDPMDQHPTPPDHVAGIGPATRTLAGLTVRRPTGSVLDLGTGCGIQALLATRHAGHVTATDLNPRALRLAATSAALNGEELDLRQGSLFEPVRGQTLGMIAANPPFVVSPDTELVFRDGNVAGDAISPAVVQGATEHLEEGGFATVLCSWIRRDGESPVTAPAAWVDGRGCDVWVLHHQSEEPLAYASTWNAFVRHDPDAYAAAVRRWLDYYDSVGVAAVETGAVILRRRTTGGPSWFLVDQMPYGPAGDATDHILRVFAARDEATTWDAADAVLAAVPRFAGAHDLEQVLTHDGARYGTHPSHLRLEQGVGLSIEVPPHLVQVLLAVDGVTTVGDLAADAADLLGADPARYAHEAAALIGRLHAAGFAELVRP